MLPENIERLLADAREFNDIPAEVGEAAWERYRAHQGGKAFDGSPIPAYKDLRAGVRAAWDSVGAALYAWGWCDGRDRESEQTDIDRMKGRI